MIDTEKFNELFYNILPDFPYCSNDVKSGIIIRPRNLAIKYEHIQTNSPFKLNSFLFDIDQAGASYVWEEKNLPTPTWIAINPINTHAHYGYILNTPVYLGERANSAPQLYAKKIKSSLNLALNGDINYHGGVTKNPLHKKWKSIYYGPKYDLGDIAEYLNLKQKIFVPEIINSRNCLLFDELRKVAYKNFRKEKDILKQLLLDEAMEINNNFPESLELFELKSIVNSVFRWITKHFNEQNFSNHQKNIRLLVGKKTDIKVKMLLSKNMSVKEIAKILDISERTVYRHIKQ